MVWGYVAGAVVAALGARKANKANQAEAEKNRAFQRDLADNAHSRQVADLRRAGLNPILSGLGGSGAATSAGSLAASQQSEADPAISSALAIRMNKAEVQNLEDTNDLIKAQTAKTKTEDATSSSQYNVNQTQTHVNNENAANLIQNTKKLLHETGSAKSIEGISNNQLFSSDIERKLDALSTEQTRRGIDRYGTTAKQLLPWSKTKNKTKN